jgi:hypothetical protein
MYQTSPPQPRRCEQASVRKRKPHPEVSPRDRETARPLVCRKAVLCGACTFLSMLRAMALFVDGSEEVPIHWENVWNRDDALAFAAAMRLKEDSEEKLPIRVPKDDIGDAWALGALSFASVGAADYLLKGSTQFVPVTAGLSALCALLFFLSLRLAVVFHADFLEVRGLVSTKYYPYREIVSVQWRFRKGTYFDGVRVWLRGRSINRDVILLVSDELAAGLAHAYHHPNSSPEKWLPVPSAIT